VKALKRAQPGETIVFTGTYRESVTITTENVTLQGVRGATIQGPGGGIAGDISQGLVNIVGARGVVIAGMTIRDSETDGINGRQGAAFTVRDVHVLESADDGIEVTEASTMRVEGICEVRGSGEEGFSITRGSSGIFQADHVTSTHNASSGISVFGTSTAAFRTGTVSTTHNTVGVVALGHASLELSLAGPTLFTAYNAVDGVITADASDLRLDGGLLYATANGRRGLSIGGGSNLTLFAGAIRIEQNAAGVGVDVGSTGAVFPAATLTIQGNTGIGLLADNGSTLRVLESATITDNDTDVVLAFGSRGTFVGNTLGTLTCDATSLVRGDVLVTCPTP
jgi:hypothetical protein